MSIVLRRGKEGDAPSGLGRVVGGRCWSYPSVVAIFSSRPGWCLAVLIRFVGVDNALPE